MKKSSLIYFLWLPVAALISFGVYFLLQWGLKPKPIPQINPTRFEQPEQVGAVAYRRLRSILRQEKLIVLGSAPWIPFSDRVWNGFVGAARQDGVRVSAIYQEQGLSQIKDFQGVKSRILTREAFAEESNRKLLSNDFKSNRLSIIHTLYDQATHSDPKSLLKKLEQDFKRPWPSITMLSFAVTPEELNELEPECPIVPEGSTENTGGLGCAAARISRKFLRKKYDPAELWAAMERHGLKEYILFIHPPNPPIQPNQ